jgi:hypothetical protein
MEVLQEKNIPYSFKESYYPKVPSLIDGTFNGTPSFFRDTEESKKYDSLVDFYSGKQRMFARRKNGSAAPLIMRDGEVIEGDPAGEVRAFRIARAWTYIQKVTGKTDFSSLKWCDMSAGWGVHLLTALLTGMEYFACDPNSSMTPIYRRMISDYNAEERCTVLEQGFEVTEVKKDYYDIFFSSPPYFDWEIYSDDKGQSINRFPNFNIWCSRFLIPCIKKGIESLKEGGTMILYQQDLKTIRYCEMVIMYILDDHKEMHFEGVISCGGKTKLSPSFIWKKVTIERPDTQYLEHYYDNVLANIVDHPESFNEQPVYEFGGPRLSVKVLVSSNGLLKIYEDKTITRGMYSHFQQCKCKNMVYFGSNEAEVRSFIGLSLTWERSAKIIFLSYHDSTTNKMKKYLNSVNVEYTIEDVFKVPKIRRKDYIDGLRHQLNQTISPKSDTFVLDFVRDICYLQMMELSLFNLLEKRVPFNRVWITTDHLDVLQALCNVTEKITSVLITKHVVRFTLMKTKFSPPYYSNTFKASDVARIDYVEVDNPLSFAKKDVRNYQYPPRPNVSTVVLKDPYSEIRDYSNIFWSVVE